MFSAKQEYVFPLLQLTSMTACHEVKKKAHCSFVAVLLAPALAFITLNMAVFYAPPPPRKMLCFISQDYCPFFVFFYLLRLASKLEYDGADSKAVFWGMRGGRGQEVNGLIPG